mmetsp:Transcript_20646/g.59822  ORF Transcript_20646/g.59822 Transcript_20646/m.59822 type:complete len:295 (-) Transcript_20646:85-969(-)|eukprot:CAMPEP_0168401014 /NCGR_PEP_ID=MMETSP0228-20121227/22891_1 /TAXON_ID=133427 /ORGANISM="Protoceratium reticulatum, Strain CCCM 535 (=CCMP 1889)" /LENGTH=294 /DNA_ID=CAMNT_0008414565 /DNA_START=57 /DNA_END=941 /DNA_ORIENTATION=+
MRAPCLFSFISLACLVADVRAESQQASLADASVLVQHLGKTGPKLRPPSAAEQALPALEEVRQLLVGLAALNETKKAGLVAPTIEEMLQWVIDSIEAVRNDTMVTETTGFLNVFSGSFNQIAMATQSRIAGFMTDRPGKDTAEVKTMIQDILTQEIADFNATWKTLALEVNASTPRMKPLFSFMLSTVQVYVSGVFGFTYTVTCDQLPILLPAVNAAQYFLQWLAIPFVDKFFPKLADRLQTAAKSFGDDLGPKISELLFGFSNATVGVLANLSKSFDTIADAFDDTNMMSFCP